MGLGEKWHFCIKGCLSSSRASVLINGSTNKEFHISKSVCQGNPLSLFLFIIAMEGLNVAMKSSCQKSVFYGVRIPNHGPSISHLFYADDVLFIGEWLSSNFDNLARILRCYHACAGLKVIFGKSQVYGIGVSTGKVNGCARIFGCDVAFFPSNIYFFLLELICRSKIGSDT